MGGAGNGGGAKGGGIGGGGKVGGCAKGGCGKMGLGGRAGGGCSARKFVEAVGSVERRERRRFVAGRVGGLAEK